MNRTRHRGGFSVVEIIVVLLLFLLVGVAVVATREVASEENNRTKCASNLKGLALAILLYSNENYGAFPRTRHDPAVEKYPAYTKPNAADAFANDGPEPNDVSASIFLLARTQDITTAIFICPSSNDSPMDYANDKTSADYSNFTAKKHLSYSYENQYGKDERRFNLDRAKTMIKAEFAILADMNPGGDKMLKLKATDDAKVLSDANSPNHKREGQNIVFMDGHVEWFSTPFVGVERDNIYTFGESGVNGGGEGVVGASKSINDSILLPTDTQDAPEKEKL